MGGLIEFMVQQSDKLLEQVLEHIGLTLVSLFIAVMIGVPIGLILTRNKNMARPALGGIGVIQTIPSIALLGFMIPLLGIGAIPGIVALFLYALLPIVRNVYTGIDEVDENIKEAAQGMGLSKNQILFQVELPLALPVIFAGIRTATVINVGVATLAALIASGGLGEFIFGGIALNNVNMILAGAIPAALLAILFDYLLSLLQKVNFRKFKLPLVSIAGAFVFLLLFFFNSGFIKPQFQAGITPEFAGRPDGYPGLKKTYDLELNTVIIQSGLMYKAVKEGKVDLISGYTTDGRIKAYELIPLKDNKDYFPPYYAAPIIRKATLQNYPGLKNLFHALKGKLNDSLMTTMNYRVDHLKKSPQTVAREFLENHNLLKDPAAKSRPGSVAIGSKIFTEQYILSEMFAILIENRLGITVNKRTGLGGTKLCFDALKTGEIDLYPEYTGTGLQVILNVSEKKRKALMNDKDKVYRYVQKNFREQYNIEWMPPLGFNNSYAMMMRKNQAKKLGIRSISNLKKYLEK